MVAFAQFSVVGLAPKKLRDGPATGHWSVTSRVPYLHPPGSTLKVPAKGGRCEPERPSRDPAGGSTEPRTVAPAAVVVGRRRPAVHQQAVLELWRRYAAPVEARVEASGGRLKLNPGQTDRRVDDDGAKTGQRRDVPLAYFTDGDDVVLIASNYGSSRYPGWYHNLRAHPECELRIGPGAALSPRRRPAAPTGTGFTTSRRTGSTMCSPCTTNEAVPVGPSR